MQDEANDRKQKDFLQSVEETWKSLYRFIYYRVQNREEAEDITQETYMKALSYFQRRNANIEQPLSFLKTISINILRDRWRSKKRAPSFEELKEESLMAPDQFTNQVEDGLLIESALAALNRDQREVIEHRIINGRSVAQTSKIMDIKAGTVRVLQYRALKKLSSILQDGKGGICE